MSLREKISSDLKESLREKKAEELSTLRLLQSAIRNKEIEKKKREEGLSDEEVIEVIASEIKKRKEAIELYEKGGRQDLANKEKAELEVLERYMPEQMDEEEILREARKVIEEVGAVGPKDMGKVMGALMTKVKGKAEGAVVNRIVREELQKKQSG